MVARPTSGTRTAKPETLLRAIHSLRKRLFDRDYSPAFQDEYQRLWHEAAAARDESARQLREMVRGDV